MYVPKSKISYKQTEGNEFIIKSTRKDYRGPYISVSNQKFYIGVDYRTKGEELLRIERTNEPQNPKRFSLIDNIRKYNYYKKTIKKRLEKTTALPSTKTIPTNKDYQKGYYYRYFARRFNGNNYIEIDKDTYDAIRNKDGRYDFNLYIVGDLQWFITGNVFKDNALTLKRVQRNHPHIFYLFPVLNEFYKATSTVQENLETSGGELYYVDGTEYIGSYHIHPTKGPMVGAIHTPTPHANLYYTNQLPSIPNISYGDFLANYNKVNCYKCILINGIYNIVGSKRSVLLGCPADSFQSYDDAQEACNNKDIEKPDFSEIVSYNVDAPPPSNPLSQGYPQGNNNFSYSSFSPASFTQEEFPDNETTIIPTQRDTSNTCFAPNTIIKMADGSDKVIAAVEVGDKVKSENGTSTVLNVMIHEGDFELYSINNGKPFVTEEHPFKTIDGWKSINPITTIEDQQISSSTLDLEDILIRLKGKQIVKKITKGKIKYPKVYNLSLDNEHVFYANGYLVHNDKTATASTVNTSSPSSGGTSGGGGGGY